MDLRRPSPLLVHGSGSDAVVELLPGIQGPASFLLVSHTEPQIPGGVTAREAGRSFKALAPREGLPWTNSLILTCER